MDIVRKNWESDFFERDWFLISFDARSYGYEDLDALRERLQALLNGAAPGLYEIELDARQLFLSPALEDCGFRLWDSQFRFLTRIDRNRLPHYAYELPDDVTLRAAAPSDREAILALNRAHLTRDTSLVSKLKSPTFSPADTERWFDAWIKNSLAEDALVSVLESGDQIGGFFIYLRRGDRDGLALYKGVLCAIDPRWRGRNLHLALQEHIFRHQVVEDEFFVDNTTQISNPAIYRNHFHSRREPRDIRLIFLRELKPGRNA